MVPVRVALGTFAVAATLVLGAAACTGDESEPELPEINLPSRRRDGDKDAGGPLEAADAGAGEAEAGPPPDPFCIEPDLVACFAFEGSLADGSPSKLVTEKAIAVGFTAGKQGQALKMEDATEIRLAPTGAFDANAATIEAWVYRDPISFGDDTVFSVDGRFAMLVEQDGTLRCRTSTGAARGGNVPIAAWTHVGCTFDGATITGYVAGVAKSSAPGTLATTADGGAGARATIGAGLVGMIDQLRVFSVARTPKPVSAAPPRAPRRSDR